MTPPSRVHLAMALAVLTRCGPSVVPPEPGHRKHEVDLLPRGREPERAPDDAADAGHLQRPYVRIPGGTPD